MVFFTYIDRTIILGTSVSIIISVLALTVPLILQMMARINTQYNSVVLIDFFIKEKIFKVFKGILIVSIIMLFLWIPTNFYQYNCINELCSCGLVIITSILVVTLFLLIKLCINYNSPAALFKQISNQHKAESKKKAVEAFSYKAVDTEARYIDAYLSLFKYAVENDGVLVKNIAQYLSTIFNSYRNNYYQYIYPKTGDQNVKYPPSYYSLINNIEKWLRDNNHENVYPPYLLLTWMYDTNQHKTYLSISTINCIWNNLIIYVKYEEIEQIQKYIHHLLLWSYKWSILYENNKYDYRQNAQYKQECENIRVLLFSLQTYMLMNGKNEMLCALWKEYDDKGTLGKYSTLFFPKTLEDILDAYSILVTILRTNKGISSLLVDSAFQNVQHLIKESINYFAFKFCDIFPTFKNENVENLKFKAPLFLSFPRGSVYKYLNQLKETIIQYNNYEDLDSLFKNVSDIIDKSNVEIITLASYNQQMLLDYFSTIQGSVKQLYNHASLYCDTKDRKDKSQIIQIPMIRRGENKRYFIEVDHIAGNAYFSQFANKLRTKMENVIFNSFSENLHSERICYANKENIATLIRKILEQNAITKDVIIINAFSDLSKIEGLQLVPPRKTNKLISHDKYRLDKINIIDIPISQSCREQNRPSFYIVKKSDAPYMHIFNPIGDNEENDLWICASKEQQIYLKLGQTYESDNGNVHVKMEMLVGVEFHINPHAKVWKVVLKEDEVTR